MIRFLLTAVLVAPLTASLQAQSLADAARKAEEQRAKAKQEQPKASDRKDTDKADKPAAATKVYTNKDVGNAQDSPLVPAADSEKKPSGSAATAASAGELVGDGSRVVRDEAWWRKHMTTLRDQLARDQSACVPKQETVARLQGLMNAIPDKAPAIVAGGYIAAAGSIGTDLVKARAELTECQGHVDADKQLIAAAEEDARVHGVLPGWLR